MLEIGNIKVKGHLVAKAISKIIKKKLVGW